MLYVVLTYNIKMTLEPAQFSRPKFAASAAVDIQPDPIPQHHTATISLYLL